MTDLKKELADRITAARLRTTHFSHGNSNTTQLVSFARQNGLIILYGDSDDLLEMRGAAEEEANGYNGGKFVLFYNEERGQQWRMEDVETLDEQIDHWAERKLANEAVEKQALVTLVWAPKDTPASWLLTSPLPHATFELYRSNDQVFSHGIVLDAQEVRKGLGLPNSFEQLQARQIKLYEDVQAALDTQLEKLGGETVYLLEPFDLKGGMMDEAQLLRKVYFTPSGDSLVAFVEHSEGTEFTNALGLENSLSLLHELENGNYQTTPIDNGDDDEEDDDSSETDGLYSGANGEHSH